MTKNNKSLKGKNMKKMTGKSRVMPFVKGMEECRDAFP